MPPVGTEVGTVAVQGTEVHKVGALEDALAVDNGVLGVEDRPVGSHEPVGDGWPLAVHRHRPIDEDGNGHQQRDHEPRAQQPVDAGLTSWSRAS